MGEQLYNEVAGRNLGRLCGLSDGVFAFALTLLVLDLHVPLPADIHTEADLLRSLTPLVPRLVICLMTFMTLGIFWVGQQTQLDQFDRTDRNLTWIHIGFLFAVVLMPFSTSLLAAFITYRTALVVYWANILLLGVWLYASVAYASRAGLYRTGLSIDVDRVHRRIFTAQGLYAFGALLCLVNTRLSIAFIVLVQLNYVLAPRLRFLYRL